MKIWTYGLMFAAVLLQIDAIAEPRYFVLGIPESLESQESFVLEFTGEQIDLARAIIAGKEESRNPRVRVVPWSSEINRNYLVPGAPAWSWSVAEFNNFAGCIMFESMASPALLEHQWDFIAFQSRMVRPSFVSICDYTVIGELPFQPELFLRNGQRFSRVFGQYSEASYPWIYFKDHGWWHVFGLNPFDIWFWTSDMGFLWTTEDVYPWLYRSSDQTWIEFKGSYDGKRGFLNSNTGEIEVWTISG